jgi:8-oxo-dGTP pyrophosphatase MutT (NUDIX family)
VSWTLTARQRTALYGHVWNDQQWFVQEVTPTQVVLEAGHYFDWLLTNRLLTQPLAALPPAAQTWVQSYPWSDPPTLLPTARIALATSGLIQDRYGRWLFVQPPRRAGWFASAGGGITPQDGADAATPQLAWVREVQEELGIAVTAVVPLGPVASPWHDEWVWGFLARWEGVWESAPWQHAPDGALEVGHVHLQTADLPLPLPLSPITAWLWDAVLQRHLLLF